MKAVQTWDFENHSMSQDDALEEVKFNRSQSQPQESQKLFD